MPFELPVPSDLPSSFEGCHGHVRYWLECNLDIVGQMEQKEILRHDEVSLCCGCGAPGYYEIRYHVNRRGFVPGERMLLDIRIKNFTNSKVNLHLKFKMTTKYHAKGKTLKVDKRLHEGQKRIDSAETLKWNPEIPIPPLPPSGLGGSRIIDIRYWLEVAMHSASFFVDSIHFADEIRIGTVPLKHTATALPVTSQSGGRFEVSGRKQLIPVGFSSPEVRALPAPDYEGNTDIFKWVPGDNDTGKLHSRVHAYCNETWHLPIQASSSSW